MRAHIYGVVSSMVHKLDMINNIFVEPLLFLLPTSIKLCCDVHIYCSNALHRFHGAAVLAMLIL